ncbi:heavy-metal-associated domain-containing protein, partial [Brachybacterium sp. AOP3-A1-3]
MNAAGRLIAYGAAVAVTFGGAFVAAGAVVPDRVVERWSAQAADTSYDDPDHGGGADTQPEAAPQKGVSMSSQGYVLSEV